MRQELGGLACPIAILGRVEHWKVNSSSICQPVRLVALLQPLWRLTKRFEGNTFLRLAKVFPSLHILQREMKEFLELYTKKNGARLRSRT